MSLTVQDFENYHRDNPHVWEAFKNFTLEAISAGRRHFGAKMVMERIRWQTMINANSDDYKINNNYSAFYARFFEKQLPKYKGFFHMRGSIADNM